MKSSRRRKGCKGLKKNRQPPLYSYIPTSLYSCLLPSIYNLQYPIYTLKICIIRGGSVVAQNGASLDNFGKFLAYFGAFVRTLVSGLLPEIPQNPHFHPKNA